MSPRKILLLLPLAVALALSSCTSGGGDDSDGGDGGGGGNTGPSNDACSVIGLSSRSAKLGDSPNLRIIDGTACSENNSPVVELTIRLRDQNQLLCSGTLITPTRVLTAAHCFLQNSQIARIDVGPSSENVTGTALVHPQAQITNAGTEAIYDVAVVSLSRALNYPTIPILVSSPIQPDDVMSIFGYGLTENQGIGELRSGQTVVSSVDEQHISARFDGEGSNSCNGDSGGPAIKSIQANGITVSGIVGLVSSGSLASCGVGDLSLYTNVTSASILNFIQSAAPGTNLL